MIPNDLILALQQTPGVGKATLQHVVQKCDFSVTTMRELLDIMDQLKREKKRIPSIGASEIQIGLEKAKAIQSKMKSEDIRMVSWYETTYPKRLKDIPDAPVLLFIKGDLSTLHAQVSVAVIGTRSPSIYGVKCSERFGAKLAEKKVVVVGGLAEGCDTGGHEGCLSAGGQTIAVLASGIDQIYPAKNRPLAHNIINNNGCLVSEYPPGTRAQKSYFVERDRIQSGLSDGVIVIETEEKGGTMHTVNFTLKQQRVLGCLKHNEEYESIKSTGNKMLIEQKKAIPLANETDLLEFLKKAHHQTHHINEEKKVYLSMVKEFPHQTSLF